MSGNGMERTPEERLDRLERSYARFSGEIDDLKKTLREVNDRLARGDDRFKELAESNAAIMTLLSKLSMAFSLAFHDAGEKAGL